jgi:hypothetical protein
MQKLWIRDKHSGSATLLYSATFFEHFLVQFTALLCLPCFLLDSDTLDKYFEALSWPKGNKYASLIWGIYCIEENCYHCQNIGTLLTNILEPIKLNPETSYLINRALERDLWALFYWPNPGKEGRCSRKFVFKFNRRYSSLFLSKSVSRPLANLYQACG